MHYYLPSNVARALSNPLELFAHSAHHSVTGVTPQYAYVIHHRQSNHKFSDFDLEMPYLATQNRPGLSSPGDGSRTITITSTPPAESDVDPKPDEPVGTLKLRGGPRKKPRQRVVWDEDVIDNEGCGKKKSKSTLTLLTLCEFGSHWHSLLYLPQAETLRRVF